MQIAIDDLRLDRLAVVYPGSRTYRLSSKVQAIPVTAISQGMNGLFPANR